MNILILGPQGSGKGTQGELLASRIGYFYLSTGQMFRELSKTDQKLAEMINNGILISDDYVVATIGQFFDKKGQYDNIIMDGSPRSIYQYQKLKEWFVSKGQKINLAIWLNISKEETIKRLSARRMDKNTGKIYNLITNPPPATLSSEDLIHRDDDKPEVIAERLAEFEAQTLPLLEVLRKDGILIEINGERPINEIQKEIVEKVKERANEAN